MATQRRGEISPYYRRDRHDNSSAPFPAPQVLSRLLQLRWQAKQEKDTAKVRAMDTQLLNDHGIYVYDSPPIWTRQTEPPFTRWRKQAAARQNKRKDMYGPRGHPLQRVGNSSIHDDDDMACTISEPVIHELLSQWIVYHTRHGGAQRERARAICFELLLHGVRINATNLEWTTDSQYVFCEKTRHDTNDTAVSKRFRKDKGQTILWSFSEEDAKRRQRIEYLVERCLEARLTGKQQEKIFIEWELQHCYGVQWNRQNQTWFADKPPTKVIVNHDDVALLQALSTVPLQSQCVSPPLVFYQDASIWNSPAYAQSATSLELGSAVANRVECLVQERIHKREESKYIEADAIRKELWDTYVSCDFECTE